MAGSIYSWSLIADDNQTADGDINWLENQNPDTVNNSARVMMKRTKELLSDLGCVNTPTGTGDAIVLTVNSSFTALATGRIVGFRAIASNTGAVTINVNGLGVKAVRKFTSAGESALAANNIRDDGLYWLVYDSLANAAAGAWILMGVGGLDTIEGDARYVKLDGTTSMNGDLTIDKVTPLINLKKTADSQAQGIIGYNTADQHIWHAYLGGATSNNFQLHRYVAGVYADTPFTVDNATGAITFATAATFSAILNANANITITNASPIINLRRTADTNATSIFGLLNAAGNYNWLMQQENTANGNDLLLLRYNTSGVFQDVPFWVNFTTGAINIAGDLNFGGVLTGALPAANLTGTVASARISGAYTGITGVGALGFGSITSGFGDIDIGGNSVDAGPGTFANTLIGNVINSVTRIFQAATNGTTLLRPNTGSTTGQLALTTAGVASAVNFTATSDERIKTNVRTIENALDKIDALRGCLFDKNGIPGMGVIAQEVEHVFPFLVHEDEVWCDENGEVLDDRKLKRVDYDAFAGLFIEAIRELREDIRNLRSQLLP